MFYPLNTFVQFSGGHVGALSTADIFDFFKTGMFLPVWGLLSFAEGVSAEKCAGLFNLVGFLLD